MRAAVARLRARGGTAAIDLSGGRRVEIAYGRVRIGPRASEAAGAARGDGSGIAGLIITGPGAYRWAAGTLDVRETAGRRGRAVAGTAAEFDADQLAWPLAVRARRAGDRMRPRGGRGSRKLSDLMIDAKIARGARAALPVVTSARGDLLFVPGLRPAEIARPDGRTRRLVRVRFQTKI